MSDTENLAIFADFENIAIGVREARFDRFDIMLVMERLLDKGRVLLKRAYADWERYRQYCRSMHEAAFELIEVPHVSYSGKNSADIQLVVDALDLCYTKSHVDTFVILSGDSDFSPLVRKLRENDKHVIGVGVKNSSSDLLIKNCDEFIYYDDLVRRSKKKHRKSGGRPRSRGRGASSAAQDLASGSAAEPEAEPAAPAAATRSSNGNSSSSSSSHSHAQASANSHAQQPQPQPSSNGHAQQQQQAGGNAQANSGASPAASNRRASAPEVPNGDEVLGNPEDALDLVLDTTEALLQERDGNLWGSIVKQTLKRKRPNFDESYYGYRAFSHLLKDAQERGLLELHRDEKSGSYVILGFGPEA